MAHPPEFAPEARLHGWIAREQPMQPETEPVDEVQEGPRVGGGAQVREGLG